LARKPTPVSIALEVVSLNGLEYIGDPLKEDSPIVCIFIGSCPVPAIVLPKEELSWIPYSFFSVTLIFAILCSNKLLPFPCD